MAPPESSNLHKTIAVGFSEWTACTTSAASMGSVRRTQGRGATLRARLGAPRFPADDRFTPCVGRPWRQIPPLDRADGARALPVVALLRAL